MMKYFIVFCCAVAAVVAIPVPQELPTPDVQPKVNGRCREVWRVGRSNGHIIVCPDGETPDLIRLRCNPSGTDDKNVIDVPVVCPVGQKPDQNGKCRDEWVVRSEIETVKNVIDAPVVCPPGQQLDQNGKCRVVWTFSEVDDKNVIDVPIVCPPGQKPDQNGKCRDEWRILSEVDTHNVIDVPIVCPDGLKPDQNGKCREIWTLFSGMRMVPGIFA